MNNRNRHIKYRQNAYKKNRIKIILIISAAVLAVLLVAFLIVGNILDKKTKKGPLDPTYGDSHSSDKQESKFPDKIGGYSLPLLEDGSRFSDRLSSVKNDANAVCLALNTPEGELLYRSQLGGEIGDVGIASDASSLSSILSQTEERELYTTAILYIPFLNGERASSDILLDYNLSLCAAIAEEALWGSIYNSNDPDEPKQAEGVNDVLFVARDATHEDLDRLMALADKIHASNESFAVGILIPEEILSGKTSIKDIDALSKHFDFMALDTTVDKEDNMLANIESRVQGMQSELLHYKMRVLLSRAATSEEREQYIASVESYSIKYWQIEP